MTKSKEQRQYEATCHPQELPEGHPRRDVWEEYIEFRNSLPINVLRLMARARAYPGMDSYVITRGDIPVVVFSHCPQSDADYYKIPIKDEEPQIVKNGHSEAHHVFAEVERLLDYLEKQKIAMRKRREELVKIVEQIPIEQQRAVKELLEMG